MSLRSFWLATSAGLVGAWVTFGGPEVISVERGQPDLTAFPLTPEEFGAAGDGVTDDTAALQAAFDALSADRAAVVMNGHYRTSARLTIANKSNFVLAGTGGIEAFGTMPTVSGTQVLYLSKCAHFELRDFRLNANGTARGRGEFAAHTLELRSCHDYTVSRVAARNAVTDSVYLSCASDEIGDPALHNHTALFEYCDFREGYRNTLSMIQGRAITFNRCTFAAAGGTAPQANVDLESNAGDIDGAIQNIAFNDCTFDGAAGYQLLVASARTPRDIRVNRPIFRNTKGGAVSWNGTDGEINDAVVEDFDAALATRALFDVGAITAAGDLAINRAMISNIANQTSSKPLLYVHSSSAGNVRMIDPVVNGTAHYLVTANAENSGIDGGTFTGTKGSAVVLADPGAFCRNAIFNDFEYNPVIIGDDDTLVEGCTFNNPTLNNSNGVIRVVGGSNATLRDLDFNNAPAADMVAVYVAAGANVGLLSDVTIDGFGSDPISVDGSITEKNEVYVNGVLDGAAAPNTVPVASPDSGLATAYETPLAIGTATLLANDNDADGDGLTVTAVQNGSNGTVSLSGTTITFTPATGYVGNATFTYTISDGEGGSDTALVTIAVQSPLGALSLAETVIAEDQAISIAIEGAFAGSTLSTDAADLPPGMALSSALRSISGTPEAPGIYAFGITETEGNDSRSTPLSIEVTEAAPILTRYNDVPTASNTAPSPIAGFRVFSQPTDLKHWGLDFGNNTDSGTIALATNADTSHPRGTLLQCATSGVGSAFIAERIRHMAFDTQVQGENADVTMESGWYQIEMVPVSGEALFWRGSSVEDGTSPTISLGIADQEDGTYRFVFNDGEETEIGSPLAYGVMRKLRWRWNAQGDYIVQLLSGGSWQTLHDASGNTFPALRTFLFGVMGATKATTIQFSATAISDTGFAEIDRDFYHYGTTTQDANHEAARMAVRIPGGMYRDQASARLRWGTSDPGASGGTSEAAVSLANLSNDILPMGLDGLNAGTTYYYRFDILDGSSNVVFTSRPYRFRTSPALGAQVPYHAAAGSCAGQTPMAHPYRDFQHTVAAATNDDFYKVLLLGDQGYEGNGFTRMDGYLGQNAPETEEAFTRKLAEFHSDIDLDRLCELTVVRSTADDHEIGNNVTGEWRDSTELANDSSSQGTGYGATTTVADLYDRGVKVCESWWYRHWLDRPADDYGYLARYKHETAGTVEIVQLDTHLLRRDGLVIHDQQLAWFKGVVDDIVTRGTASEVRLVAQTNFNDHIKATESWKFLARQEYKEALEYLFDSIPQTVQVIEIAGDAHFIVQFNRAQAALKYSDIPPNFVGELVASGMASDVHNKDKVSDWGFDLQTLQANNPWVKSSPTIVRSSALTDSMDLEFQVDGQTYTHALVEPDITAPVLTAGDSTVSGSSSASIFVTTDDNVGTLYWAVTTSATPPSNADLKAGTGAAGSGSETVSQAGEHTFVVNGLSPSTTYYEHFLHRDLNGNEGVASGDGFTTTAADTSSPVRELTLTRTDTPGFLAGAPNEDQGVSHVWRATDVVFPAAAGDYVLWEWGGNARSAAVYLTSAGRLAVRAGEGSSISANQTAYADVDVSAYLGTTQNITWHVDMTLNQVKLWIGDDLATTGTAPNHLGGQFTGGDNGGFGTTRGTTSPDIPLVDWPNHEAGGLGVLEVYRNQTVVVGSASDSTAPTITSASEITVTSNEQLAHQLTADEAVTWSFHGGADNYEFQLSGSTLQWADNGTRDFANPVDLNGDNGYKVWVVATDDANNSTEQLVTVTVVEAGAPASYSTEAEAYFAQMSAQPDATRKGLLDDLIAGLVADGIWAKLDNIWLLAAHDAQAGLINAREPGVGNLSPVNSPTFTADRGYQGNGSSSYLDIGRSWYSPNQRMNRDDAAFGSWCNFDGGASIDSRQTHIGCADNFRAYIQANSGGDDRARINDSGTFTYTGPADRTGHRAISRYNDTSREMFVNGASAGTNNAPSDAISQGNGRLLARTNDFSPDRLAAAWSGGSLTATEQTAMHNRLNTYLTAIGAN